ncbi:peptidylprolyl isomerase, partial [Rhodotorula sp. JG-1b]
MGLKHREYLAVPATSTGGKVLGCKRCRTHLTTSEQIESKARTDRNPLPWHAQNFNGQHGRAYLFTNVVNVALGPPEDRPMTTGLHTVRDVMCSKCGETLGWKYDRAYEATQKYKEGKFILERAMWS